jgi:hypothetical protein
VQELIVARKEQALADKITRHCAGLHPGYIFQVYVAGGIARISHPLLPPNHGYVVQLNDIITQSGWDYWLRQAAGFILEIFNLPRGRYNRDIMRERSQEHRKTKLGIFPRQNGKLILPDWHGAKN